MARPMGPSQIVILASGTHCEVDVFDTQCAECRPTRQRQAVYAGDPSSISYKFVTSFN